MESTQRFDIFPRHFSKSINRLCYPEKKFGDFQNNAILFMQHLDNQLWKVYNYRISWTEKYYAHIILVGKSSQTLGEFYPEKIDWCRVAKKLSKTPSQAFRTSVEHRAAFKNGNRFLVKADFTLGQRTVREGTVHVVQTLNVPLMFYLMKNKTSRKGEWTDKRLAIVDALLPCKYMYLYDRRILLPNGCYRIPPGSTYILYSTQKNFFSIDVFPEDAQIPLVNVMDPVAQRILKMPDIYDRPMQTPYIEDVVEQEKSKALEDLFESIRSPSSSSTTTTTTTSSTASTAATTSAFFLVEQEASFERPPVQEASFVPPEEPLFKRPFSRLEREASFVPPEEPLFKRPFSRLEREASFVPPEEPPFKRPFIRPPPEEPPFKRPFIRPPPEEPPFIQLLPPEEQQPVIPEQQPVITEQQPVIPDQIYSRSVVVAHPDCIRYYRELFRKTELPSPIGNFKTNEGGDDEPLDLSVKGIIYPDYNLQNPECVVQNPECVVQNPECVVQNLDYNLQNVDYNLQNPECVVQNPECVVQNTDCYFQNLEFDFQSLDSVLEDLNCNFQNLDDNLQQYNNLDFDLFSI